MTKEVENMNREEYLEYIGNTYSQKIKLDFIMELRKTHEDKELIDVLARNDNYDELIKVALTKDLNKVENKGLADIIVKKWSGLEYQITEELGKANRKINLTEDIYNKLLENKYIYNKKMLMKNLVNQESITEEKIMKDLEREYPRCLVAVYRKNKSKELLDKLYKKRLITIDRMMVESGEKEYVRRVYKRQMVTKMGNTQTKVKLFKSKFITTEEKENILNTEEDAGEFIRKLNEEYINLSDKNELKKFLNTKAYIDENLAEVIMTNEGLFERMRKGNLDYNNERTLYSLIKNSALNKKCLGRIIDYYESEGSYNGYYELSLLLFKSIYNNTKGYSEEELIELYKKDLFGWVKELFITILPENVKAYISL